MKYLKSAFTLDLFQFHKVEGHLLGYTALMRFEMLKLFVAVNRFVSSKHVDRFNPTYDGVSASAAFRGLSYCVNFLNCLYDWQ